MSATYFVQGCPTCGRLLQVRVEYLGRSLVCQHCRGSFLASDPATTPHVPSDSAEGLLERVDELIASANEPRPNVQWRES